MSQSLSRLPRLDRRQWLLAVAGAAAVPGLAFAADKKPRPISADPSGIAPVLSGSGKPVLYAGSTIHIPSFRVEVVREMSKSSQTSGFAAAGRASQSSTYRLDGVDDGRMHALTQALYDQLVADLTAQGFKVATPAETRADPDLGPMMAGRPSPVTAPARSGSSTFYAPAGLSVALLATDASAAGGAGVGAALAGFGAFGEATKRALATNRAVQRGLTVIEPKYALGFADLSSGTDGFLGRMSDVASVSANIGLRVDPESTRWDMMAPAKNRDGLTGGHFLVDTPLMIPGESLTRAADATTAAQTSGSMVANILGAAVAGSGYGGGTQYSANTRAVRATPLFAPIAQSALSTVQKAMLARVSAPQR